MVMADVCSHLRSKYLPFERFYKIKPLSVHFTKLWYLSFLIGPIEIAVVYLNNDLIRALLSASLLYLLGIQDPWPHCTPITESFPKQPERPARQMLASFVICRVPKLVGPWLFCFIRVESFDWVNHQHVHRTLKTFGLSPPSFFHKGLQTP